ncbi:hypothetical protein BTR23_22810 [Alkalihalophilus pseudofirmus]|nr:hypothetical protein BTR23_22810 [Alkalihalophilus pseudofirmus]
MLLKFILVRNHTILFDFFFNGTGLTNAYERKVAIIILKWKFTNSINRKTNNKMGDIFSHVFLLLK